VSSAGRSTAGPSAVLHAVVDHLVDQYLDVTDAVRDDIDHLYKANEQINAYGDLLNSILQSNIAQVTVAQNEDMRKITAWAAIIAVPTLICGVYGMNLDHMPELHWTYGYPIIVPVMVTACLLIHRGFHRNGWL
jgi:magnesium transporter